MYYRHLGSKRDALHYHQCITDIDKRQSIRDNILQTMYYRQCIAEFDEVGAVLEDAHRPHGLALCTATCVTDNV